VAEGTVAIQGRKVAVVEQGLTDARCVGVVIESIGRIGDRRGRIGQALDERELGGGEAGEARID
jgi:hypothetical protein